MYARLLFWMDRMVDGHDVLGYDYVLLFWMDGNNKTIKQ